MLINKNISFLDPLLCYTFFQEENVPNDHHCMALWDTYNMLDNIRKHSLVVAGLAEGLASHAITKGALDYRKISRAGGLLHDIAKSYTVAYGGDHYQLGGAWVVCSTKNYRLAQIVFNHGVWVWSLPENLVHPLFFVLYADKRVKNTQVVTVDERYTDLLNRYGQTQQRKDAIYASWSQTLKIEQILAKELEIPLHESTFISRWLVHRT